MNTEAAKARCEAATPGLTEQDREQFEQIRRELTECVNPFAPFCSSEVKTRVMMAVHDFQAKSLRYAAFLLDLIARLTAALADAQKITGDTSDGYHTFNELYHHRAILFAAICNDRPKMAWKARKHNDGTMYDGMFIVGIETSEGQATYHYDLCYWDAYKVRELETAPEWDGHTPAQAIERIGSLPSLDTALSDMTAERDKLREQIDREEHEFEALITQREKERDAAQQRAAAAEAALAIRKHAVLTPIYTCGGHGYEDDDDEDFWCPVCHGHLGTHHGYKTDCPRCGQTINGDGEPIYHYRDMLRSEEEWRGPDAQPGSA